MTFFINKFLFVDIVVVVVVVVLKIWKIPVPGSTTVYVGTYEVPLLPTKLISGSYKSPLVLTLRSTGYEFKLRLHY